MGRPATSSVSSGPGRRVMPEDDPPAPRGGGLLGYRAAVAGNRWVSLRLAWDAALYGPAGFYRPNARPTISARRHMRPPLFAEAVVGLVRREGLARRVRRRRRRGRAACSGPSRSHRISTSVGVDVTERPSPLPDEVGWLPELPADYDGTGLRQRAAGQHPLRRRRARPRRSSCRMVEVDPGTGDQRLGPPAAEGDAAWLDRWWPLSRARPAGRGGATRESLVGGHLRAATPAGLCVAVDYGHLPAVDRPGGSLSSYRAGVQTPVSLDGRHDVTAAVAFDALAAAVGGELHRQRDILHELGVDGARPPLSLASSDPRRYLRGAGSRDRGRRADRRGRPRGLLLAAHSRDALSRTRGWRRHTTAAR